MLSTEDSTGLMKAYPILSSCLLNTEYRIALMIVYHITGLLSTEDSTGLTIAYHTNTLLSTEDSAFKYKFKFIVHQK